MADGIAELVLGSLPLVDYTDDDGWRIDAKATTAGWGNPQAVDIIVRTLIQQGSSVVTDRWDNREASITVAIEATDGRALALGEAALFGELWKRNQLVWTPPQDFAAPTVFRVVTSRLDHTFDSVDETVSRRVYQVVLTCEPFARSVAETITEALGQAVDGGGVPITPVNVLVDDCNVTTGWTALGSGQTAELSPNGNLRNAPLTSFPQLKRTGAIPMATTPLLVVDAQMQSDLSGLTPMVQFISAAGSTWVSPIGSTTSPTAGFTRYYYETPYTDLTAIVVGRANIGKPANIGTGRVVLAEVRRMNNPPAEGTLRQKMFTADVKGSAPSDGRLEVWHDTSPLGTVIVYTWQDDDGPGFVPALRSRRISGGVTTSDSTLISGGRDTISSTAITYEVPAALMPPATYELGAWLRSSTTTAQVDYTVQLFQGTTGRDTITGSSKITMGAANTWEYHVIARLQLPPARVLPGSSATVRVTLDSTAGSPTVVDVDEAYLFDLEHGSLTIAATGAATRLRIEAPTMEWPMPSVLAGTLADGSDMVELAPLAGGVHPTNPPRMSIFAVTPTALDAHALVGQYAAWHTHAPE
ncbi:MAG: hypothetical protein HOV66_00055 [Streptomycetaceae bacterium]|nr:hypothetical protein [Streptomycetaceae bacterium]